MGKIALYLAGLALCMTTLGTPAAAQRARTARGEMHTLHAPFARTPATRPKPVYDEAYVRLAQPYESRAPQTALRAAALQSPRFFLGPSFALYYPPERPMALLPRFAGPLREAQGRYPPERAATQRTLAPSPRRYVSPPEPPPPPPKIPSSVILMIGDGMGINHVNCYGGFISTLPVKTWMEVSPFVCTGPDDRDNCCNPGWCIVDSAAAATALSCGIRTRNSRAGIGPDGAPCDHTALAALDRGHSVLMATNDSIRGATQAGFFAHVLSRHYGETIALHGQKARERGMAIFTNAEGLNSPAAFTRNLVEQFHAAGGKDGHINGQPFFWIIEEAAIDWRSHDIPPNFPGVMERMADFDQAVKTAFNFALRYPNITLVILGDHETGGLGENCVFAGHGNHTADLVPVYAFGRYADLFVGKERYCTHPLHGRDFYAGFDNCLGIDGVGRRLRRALLSN